MGFYHLLATKKEEKNKQFDICEYDLDESFLLNNIISPYESDKEFIVDGYRLTKKDLSRFKIVETNDNIQKVLSVAQRKIPDNVLMFYQKNDVFNDGGLSKDVTTKMLKILKKAEKEIEQQHNNSFEKKHIFIVHGHDAGRRNEVENFVREIGFEPIVLFREADEGLTILDKFERYSNKVCYALILYTPCDIGCLKSQNNPKPRARQNVVFEHGYLLAKLGRNKVCAIVDGNDIEMPNDLSGLIYKSFDDGSWRFKVAQEMKSAGISVDLNRIK